MDITGFVHSDTIKIVTWLMCLIAGANSLFLFWKNLMIMGKKIREKVISYFIKEKDGDDVKDDNGKDDGNGNGNSKDSNGQKNKKGSMSRIKILAILLPLAVASTVLSLQAAYPLPPHSKLTTKAFRAWDKKDYQKAIDYSQECIDEFLPAAKDLQKQFDPNGTKAESLPPTGKVDGKKEREVVFALGPLNDVATCYWIKGRSAEKLELDEEAKKAYENAAKLTGARCWDKGGWFWSPANDAAGRLEQIEE